MDVLRTETAVCSVTSDALNRRAVPRKRQGVANTETLTRVSNASDVASFPGTRVLFHASGAVGKAGYSDWL